MPPGLVVTLTIAGSLFLIWLFLVTLFTPVVPYHIRKRVDAASSDLLHLMTSTCQSEVHHGNSVSVFRNGEEFYPAMLAAIRGATQSVNLECYVFDAGKTGRLFVEALSDRARAGVVVTVVLDAIGSARWRRADFSALRRAGGRVEIYRSLSWHSLHRLNNRTHRDILVVDGRVAFVGGAGVSDRWAMATRTPQWRDTMVRVEG